MVEFDSKFAQVVNLAHWVFNPDVRSAHRLEQETLKLIRSKEDKWPEAMVGNISRQLLKDDELGIDSSDRGHKTTIQKEITIGALAGAITHDPRCWVRNAAVQALEGLSHPVALAHLARAAFDSSGLVSASALCALGAAVTRGQQSLESKKEYSTSISNAVLEALAQNKWPLGSKFDEWHQNRFTTGIAEYSPRNQLHLILRRCCASENLDAPIISLIADRKFSDQDRCRMLHLCYFNGPERDRIYDAAANIAGNEFQPLLVRRYADRLACLGSNLDYVSCFDLESCKSLEGGI